MSIDAKRWWLAQPKFGAAGRQVFTGSQSAVMGYLAEMTNQRLHYAWPSFRTMSKETGIEVHSLHRVVGWLRSAGWVRIQSAYNAESDHALSPHYFLPYAPGPNPWRWWDERLRDADGEVAMEPFEKEPGLWSLRPLSEDS